MGPDLWMTPGGKGKIEKIERGGGVLARKKGVPPWRVTSAFRRANLLIQIGKPEEILPLLLPPEQGWAKILCEQV